MFRQFSIGVRASAAFGIIGILVLVLGIFSFNRLASVTSELTLITSQKVPALDLVNELDREFLRVRVHSANIATYINDEERLARYLERYADAKQKLKQAQQNFDRVAENPQIRAIFKDYLELDRQFWELQEQFDKLVAAKLSDPIASLRENTLLPLTGKISSTLDQLLKAQLDVVQSVGDEATSTADTAKIAVVVVLAVVLVLLTLFAIVLTRSIVQPISAAVDFAQVIAERDLTQDISIVGNDEPAQLLRQLRKTQQQLRASISQISESSEQLASTSEELSSVTNESTRTIQQQTEELEQAATAVNELTAAVENVAQDAQSASQASEDADEQAQLGNDRVRKTVTAIEALSQEIGDSSSSVTELANKVTDITKVLEVIRGIAEQTNLLALNAAIEAARAGESGRGFAVVADEVRSLAHKTQQSTVEIEDMVKAINASSDRSVSTMQRSMERASSTLDIAREAGEALKQIAQAVSEINTHNTSIASAAEEQANVARDVDMNLVSIRDLSNSTASGAEQTSASSQELSRLAVDLNNLVEQFKTK